MFTPADELTEWSYTFGQAMRLALCCTVAICCTVALCAGAGCVFDRSGFGFSDIQNDNQNYNSNSNSNLNQNQNQNQNENSNVAGCGDGIVVSAELCDDGNLIDGDGCNEQCTVENGWQCTRDNPSVCTTVCGDGIFVGGHEVCDDGNLIDGDGCSAGCDLEDFFACSGDPSDCTCVVYVSQASTGPSPQGGSWSDAIRSVDVGIAAAAALVPSQLSCEAWVAEGTYFVYEQSVADSIVLQSQVRLYGGFTGVETARNQSTASPGGAIRNDASNLTVTNSILWADQPQELETVNSITTVSYSAVQSGAVFVGPGNINSAPRFIDVPGNNFRLDPGSPCIDATDSNAAPFLDLDYFARVDAPLTPDTGLGTPPADMGAYEYQP